MGRGKGARQLVGQPAAIGLYHPDSLGAVRNPPADVKLSTSIYELRINSLQAPSLRASLSKRVGAIPSGAVFENPSVEKLVSFCERKKQKDTSDGNVESRIGYIQRTMYRCTAEIRAWPAAPKITT